MKKQLHLFSLANGRTMRVATKTQSRNALESVSFLDGQPIEGLDALDALLIALEATAKADGRNGAVGEIQLPSGRTLYLAADHRTTNGFACVKPNSPPQ